MRVPAIHVLIKSVFLLVAIMLFYIIASTFVSMWNDTRNTENTAYFPRDDLKKKAQHAPSMKSFDAGPGIHSRPVESERVEPVKDWHNYAQMKRDARRSGIGEHGRPYELSIKSKKKLQKKLSLENGFNAMLSDLISVNRSVRDIRPKGCLTKKYLADLPAVSIIIPFYNEHFKTLLRSIHSIVNRTPSELLNEIILVDDCSTLEELDEPLDDYVKNNFRKVTIIRLGRRKGLIAARIAGALEATAKVLVFMEAHIEANYNWLPPLLEPIALDPQTVVCPFIDSIDDKTFAYTAQDEGARGAFDWSMNYKRLPLMPEDLEDNTKPFANPIMSGGLFGINAKFFWKLGGYDDGLQIWGGEQYELSFKIWMCGGRILDAPCSRVGHIFRGDWIGQPGPADTHYFERNIKRVAEVWMDEYKQYIYDRGNGVYEMIDAGDISEQMAIRDKMHCRSFKWFMENVAFDLLRAYPTTPLPKYAYGAIRSVAASKLCIDTAGKPDYKTVVLRTCDKDLEEPKRGQDWELSYRRDIRMRNEQYCIEVATFSKNAAVMLWDCHNAGNNQSWYYDLQTQQIINGRNKNKCLHALVPQRAVAVNNCKNIKAMQWTFGVVNHTAFDRYSTEA